MKLLRLKIFSICHRCQRYWWCTLSCEYVHEFSKKYETALMVYSGAWGKLIHEKNLKSKISWHCPFKWGRRTRTCVIEGERTGRAPVQDVVRVRKREDLQHGQGSMVGDPCRFGQSQLPRGNPNAGRRYIIERENRFSSCKVDECSEVWWYSICRFII